MTNFMRACLISLPCLSIGSGSEAREPAARRGSADLTSLDWTLELNSETLRRDKQGRTYAEVPASPELSFTNGLTVEAWINADRPASEGLQTIVSKWTTRDAFDRFAAFDASRTSGLNTAGFLGAVFDGRYIYFSPQHDLERRSGKVLRYDTHRPLDDPGAYTGYDAENTAGLDTRGYYGACFDGWYIYFVPRYDGQQLHSRVLRYDTQSEFTKRQSWDAHDAELAVSHQGVAFDGQFIYFASGYDQDGRASGIVLRYDTTGGFHKVESWSMYNTETIGGDTLPTANFDGAAFDGRFIYFVPLDHGVVVRYDSHAPFSDSCSWAAWDVRPLGVKWCVGSVFDGRYLYLVPYGETKVVVRYDTRGEFQAANSWQAYDATDTGGLFTTGYDGGAFDGRYVYFIPFWDARGRWHSNFLRYDTQEAFESAAAWTSADAANTNEIRTVGYNGGAFDGRYLYCAPWHDFTGYPEKILGHGRVLRYDTVGDGGSFSLRWSDYGHNGGLCAAVPGPSFVINTRQGARSVAAHRCFAAGPHYLAGTYDGNTVRLYIDGELIAQREASGKIVSNETPITIGRIHAGEGYFAGVIQRVRISRQAKRAETILETYRQGINSSRR